MKLAKIFMTPAYEIMSDARGLHDPPFVSFAKVAGRNVSIGPVHRGRKGLQERNVVTMRSPLFFRYPICVKTSCPPWISL